ncbi:inter-alpha-trypsin inhibitor heavy chain H4 isoform X2 [Tamandua tetradactyla]|uniref:inter-alpha-trypsin inhibitor heavy chain H4 isoform X2 n=1 Tax=Tamandua tetradactyla TaxID=48850 RepID=UPI0040545A4B
MKTRAPAHTWGLTPVLLLLLAVLQTTSAEKNGIDIYSLTVDSRVSARFAHTVITSRVVNRAGARREATFQMELPKKAFITNFSMVIDGVTYPGNIKEKAAAQEQYSAAVARGESAGLVKATGRKTEQFQVSVTVAPAAKVTFELVYEELLQRHLGAYELLLKIRPQQLVQHFQMDIHIFEPQGISFLETESTFLTSQLVDALTTSQNKTKAHIRFKPSLSQQQKSSQQQETVLDGNFIIRYDVNRTHSGGSIHIENGYFVHYFAPEGLPTMPKSVIFVIDVSGSMSGKKIQQTREALIKILDDLSPRDQFNLIIFNSEATQWKPALLPASADNVKEAKSFAARILAQGGTNINEALLLAVKLLENSNREELLPSGGVALLILLTDGDPTVGETNPLKIQKNVREAIGGQYSLFCLGFGFDVNYAFLEKLGLENGGLARRIYEDSDSALQLQDFYQEVANPLMTAVTFEYLGNAVETVTRDKFRLLFKGSEIVVAGKLRDPDMLFAKVRGQVNQQNFTFQAESKVAEKEEEFRSPKYIFHNFIERLWAYLTIQQLLEQVVSTPDAGQQALKNRTLCLSLKYNFVTPLTSMVVTKPEGQGQSRVAEKPVEGENRHKDVSSGLAHTAFRSHYVVDEGARRTVGVNKKLAKLSTMTRYYGPSLPAPPPSFPHLDGRWLPPDLSVSLSAPDHVVDMDFKETTRTASLPAPAQAPHAILTLPGQSVDQLCVDVAHAQESLDLLSDPDQGVEVTGEYEAKKHQFSWIKVAFKDPQVEIQAFPEHVVMIRNQRSSAYKWKETLYLVMPGLKMTMNKAGLLLLSGPGKVTIGLLAWEGPGAGLRLLLQDTDRFSSQVAGTLGQFYQNLLWEPSAAEDDSRRTLRVQGNEYSASRTLKLDYQEGPPGKEISCWCVEL